MRSLISKLRIHRWLVLVLALAGASSIAGQAPPARQTQPVFPSRVDLVTVDVVVLDRQGNPVDGLTQADFVVKENGERQAVTAFEAVSLTDSPPAQQARQRVSTNNLPGDAPARSFFVIFDDVNLSQYSTPRAQKAVVDFIERALRPGDQVMIAPTSGGGWWTGRLPEDRAALKAFVERLQGTRRPDTTAAHIWDHEAMAIALARDPHAPAQVARRYFESALIPEAYPTDRQLSKELEVSPGIPLIQAKAREVYREAVGRLRVSLGTLERIAESLAQTRGRKTLLFVSEGFIMDPSQVEFRRLVQAARNANAAVHFVDARDPAGMLGQPGMPGGSAEVWAPLEERDTTTALALAVHEAEGAHSVAIDTGGTTVAGTDLLQGLTRIAKEARAYYLLGYSSTNQKKDGRFRKIEVAVNRPDVTVRARGGYYAPSEKEARPASNDELDPSVRAGLDAPFGASGIALRLTSYTLGPQADGKSQVLLLAEAEVAQLRLEPKAGRYQAALDSYVVVNGLDGGDPQIQERLLELDMPAAVFQDVRSTGVPIRREFSLAPGKYQARLLLRDRASGVLGSVRHEFDVPPVAEFRVSTPIVTDVTQPGSAGQPGRPVPIARRTFQAGTRLYCAFDIYGAAPDAARGGPRVTLAYSLRRADGTEVKAAPPSPLKAGALGQLPVTIALTIPEGAVGEHELRLVVRDEVSTRVLEVSEPLVIAPR